MTIKTMPGLIRRMRCRAHPRHENALSDSQLLERFLHRREEPAFAELVRRHGPMVLGVCRRVLRHAQDAEDAFQATFLVLVRKAGGVARRHLLGNWLYGVAYRTALAARTGAARRRVKERHTAMHPAYEAAPAAEGQDLRALVDRELSRLPDKYRAPVVLCDLEGRSRRDAARMLGCTEGTLSGRLARARGLLAKRLGRSGVALSGVALAAGLAPAASAAVPAKLAVQTVMAAAQVAAGKVAGGMAGGAVSASVAALTERVVLAMLVNKCKVGVGLVLALALSLGLGGVTYQASAASPREDRPARSADARKSRPAQQLIWIEANADELIRTEAEGIFEIVLDRAPGNAIRQGKRDEPVTFDFKVKQRPTFEMFWQDKPAMSEGGVVHLKVDAKAVFDRAMPVEVAGDVLLLSVDSGDVLKGVVREARVESYAWVTTDHPVQDLFNVLTVPAQQSTYWVTTTAGAPPGDKYFLLRTDGTVRVSRTPPERAFRVRVPPPPDVHREKVMSGDVRVDAPVRIDLELSTIDVAEDKVKTAYKRLRQSGADRKALAAALRDLERAVAQMKRALADADDDD
jgi:RNA polymerase sigma factor (sigma-70 family)